MGYFSYLFALTLTFLVVGYIFGIASLDAHEKAHVEIFKSYGVKADYKLDYLHGNGSTFPIGNNSDKCYDNPDCVKYHDLNEIVSYNLTTVTFAIISSFYLLGVIIGGLFYWYVAEKKIEREEQREIEQELQEEKCGAKQIESDLDLSNDII